MKFAKAIRLTTGVLLGGSTLMLPSSLVADEAASRSAQALIRNLTTTRALVAKQVAGGKADNRKHQFSFYYKQSQGFVAKRTRMPRPSKTLSTIN